MDIFSVFSMIGGLALFLYGMHIMGEGLTKLSGGTLERTLEKLTTNKIKAVALGAVVTAVIQSSSATTVMVVGFVNSGIMKLGQAIGIIMGANVGTTITSWILSLTGIESENFFIRLLKPTSFSPILAAIGIIFILFSKKDKKKDIGGILIGFAILMFGMETMSDAVKPLAEVEAFTRLFTMFQNPFLGMIVGAILTAVIQSSSASVGILQSLCRTGSVAYSAAIPIIMGQNIGTCITAIFSSVGASKNAKRTAVVHLLFNVIGTIVFMVVFYSINAIVHFEFLDATANQMGIAVIHTCFNIAATLLLLPFSVVLEKLSYLIVQIDDEEREEMQNGSKEKEVFMRLDDRFLATPSFALEQSKNITIQMAEITRDSLFESMELIFDYSKKRAAEVERYETTIDHYEDKIGSYLVKLASKNLTEKDSHELSMLQHSINDFERISDHSLNIMETAKEMNKKEQEFSNKAKEELRIYTAAVEEIVKLTVEAFEHQDKKLAAEIEPLEEVIDVMQKDIKKRHVKRLHKGKCTVDLGLMLADISMNFERIADHCSNIAIYVLQIDEDAPTAHEYIDTMPKEEGTEFANKVKKYRQKYMLP